tara:strand:+ start:337 stop:507 length:171 start_codon:yes stop_codon:yes gene_type:complete
LKFVTAEGLVFYKQGKAIAGWGKRGAKSWTKNLRKQFNVDEGRVAIAQISQGFTSS